MRHIGPGFTACNIIVAQAGNASSIQLQTLQWNHHHLISGNLYLSTVHSLLWVVVIFRTSEQLSAVGAVDYRTFGFFGGQHSPMAGGEDVQPILYGVGCDCSRHSLIPKEGVLSLEVSRPHAVVP